MFCKKARPVWKGSPERVICSALPVHHTFCITRETLTLTLKSLTVLSGTLSQWVSRLRQLTYSEPCRYAPIKENGTLIGLHCPSFKRIHLPLVSFKKLYCYNYAQPERFQALGCHGESLRELELDMLPDGAIPHLFRLLKRCTNLASLSLTGECQG